MCLVVYLGVDGELTGFSGPQKGDEGLDPNPNIIPAALSQKEKVYGVATYGGDGKWSCSCIFRDDINPWELEKGYDPQIPATAWREEAYAVLGQIIRSALNVDSEPLLFSCLSGDEDKQPEITRMLTPANVQPTRHVFGNVLDGGDGIMTPPILIRLTDGEMDGAK